ncbi:DUF262 domain-containing protein [Frondihabitans australicus]|uniref:Uncharacterized protein DUF1524 n=1 Tax=Frondihabitans australicus TaxID=386892 RepID=A0A495IBW1_9MICO|nr:DUF262 domain-containing protein [Frondihabitans australicus]RKR73493.1 uncharacterized protein DUF1524 [Frondihabitans australicus]
MLTQVTSPQQVFFAPQRLVVPLFQRPYVWSRELQWEPLWNDITRLVDAIAAGDSQATHFLGAVVLQTQQTVLGGLPQHTVIDGQQRLTTLQVLLDALHAELVDRGYVGLAGQVEGLVENGESFRVGVEDRFKVWPTNRDRETFAAVMSAPSPVDYRVLPAGRLRDAHEFFARSIASWLDSDASTADSRAGLLVPAVTTRLQLVSIQLQANEDAQEIFETLNARGTPLTAADLIKNFVFQRFDGTDEATEQAYLEYWYAFETPFWEAEVTAGRIRYTRSSLFLTQWLTARTLLDIPAREVFAQFKRYVNSSSGDVNALLKDLKAAADRYRAFTEASESHDGALDRVALFVYRISTLDSELAKPVLIWLGEREQAAITDDERDRFLGVLESWFVRRALVRVQSQGANRFIVDLLTTLSQRPAGARIDDVARDFLTSQRSTVGYWPDDAEVRRELVDLEAYRRLRRGRLRMVLEAVEDRYRGFGIDGQRPFSAAPVSRGVCTIEHIMPQEWRANWGDDTVNDTDRDQLVQTLGNLTLVTQSLNTRLSNAGWTGEAGKRASLIRHDTLLLVRNVVHEHAEAWTEEDIRTRTSSLIDSILAIWPVPQGHVSSTDSAVERAQYRVEVADLLRAGAVSAGAVLYAKPAAYRGSTAIVEENGHLAMADRVFATVSGAARFLQGGGTVAGWNFWCVDETLTRTLADVRSDYASGI